MVHDTLAILVRYGNLIGAIVRFCLLEQYLPNGPNYPFAQTMIKHFDKLQTPLKSIVNYPTLEKQISRFNDIGGWPCVVARSLWDLWSDETFLTRQQRVALNAVEPFDEYEEFALFASHYFLLVATKTPEHSDSILRNPGTEGNTRVRDGSICPYINRSRTLLHRIEESSISNPTSKYTHHPEKHAGARYGALLPMDVNGFGHHGGLGAQCRLQSTDFYALDNVKTPRDLTTPSVAPQARMCHTITAFHEFGCLLVGGRASPDNAFADCWLYRDHTWERVEDLPNPLYRHSSVFVRSKNNTPGILVYGGRSNRAAVMNDWLLWQEAVGWKKLHSVGKALAPRFGAAIVNNKAGTSGLLLGGMGEDGTVLPEIWGWSFDCTGPISRIVIKDQAHQLQQFPRLGSAVYRFGTSLTWSPRGLLLVGGILGGKLLKDDLDILGLISVQRKLLSDNELPLHPFLVYDRLPTYRPLLIGHSVFSHTNRNELIVVGGGAVCFSFGTYWNNGFWILHDAYDVDKNTRWSLVEHHVDTNAKKPILDDLFSGEGPFETVKGSPTLIPRVLCESSVFFETVVNHSKPVVFEGLNLGPCVEIWSLEYLKGAVGSERPVSLAILTACYFSDNNRLWFTKLQTFI